MSDERSAEHDPQPMPTAGDGRDVMAGVPVYDPVNHPKHYTSHPSGVECVVIAEHMDFLTGNALKYIWRAGLKDSNSKVQDLKKCSWYIQRAIEKEENNDKAH